MNSPAAINPPPTSGSSAKRILRLFAVIVGGLALALSAWNVYDWSSQMYGGLGCDFTSSHISDLASRARSVAACRAVAGDSLNYAAVSFVVGVALLLVAAFTGTKRRTA